MKRIYFFLFITLSFNAVNFGQSITDAYVNPGYGTIQNSIVLTYSIGDIFYGELPGPDIFLTGMPYSGHKEKVTDIPVESAWGIGFYPNPCRSVLYIVTGIKEEITFSLFSLNGVILKHGKVPVNREIGLSDIPNGVYIILIMDPDLQYYFTDKLLKVN